MASGLSTLPASEPKVGLICVCLKPVGGFAHPPFGFENFQCNLNRRIKLKTLDAGTDPLNFRNAQKL
jgi:hypothetical protein